MGTTNNTPIWQLTVEEFLDILNDDFENKIVKIYDTVLEKKTKEHDYVYGIKGIAKLFECSRTTAQKLKSSGILNDAIIQNGRKILVNKKRALELFKTHYSK